MTDHIAQFRSAIENAGLVPPLEIIDDGKRRRFSTNGKRSDEAGWYLLHGDGLPAGAFGCWRAGVSETWCASERYALSGQERHQQRERIESLRRQQEAEQQERHALAQAEARKRWNDASEAVEHAYLLSKGVRSYGVKVDGSGLLLVPMRDVNGTLHSL